jgi:hypothetical protein
MGRGEGQTFVSLRILNWISKCHRLTIANVAGPYLGGESINDYRCPGTRSCNKIDAATGTAEGARNHDSNCQNNRSVHASETTAKSFAKPSRGELTGPASSGRIGRRAEAPRKGMDF